MGGLVDWLTGLPIGALYVAIAAIAAVENFFPPIPADTIVALGRLTGDTEGLAYVCDWACFRDR